jgi:hypothetical protein
VTAGRGDEMLNILVNDSFSTTKSKKSKVKTGKNDKKVSKKALPQAGYSAVEILQMKTQQKNPTAKPTVYFKDFERRFDELLVKNKTPNPTLSTISTPGKHDSLSNDLPLQRQKNIVAKKKKPKRPKTPVFF